jgi:hypothetical protein
MSYPEAFFRRQILRWIELYNPRTEDNSRYLSEGLQSHLNQLRSAPHNKGDKARYKYAEGYKFTERMRSGWKVQAIIESGDGTI